MMNGSTAIWSKASYRQHQQEVGHAKPGLAAQAEQSGLAVPQVRQLPDPEHHFCTVVELELLYKPSTVYTAIAMWYFCLAPFCAEYTPLPCAAVLSVWKLLLGMSQPASYKML